MGGTSRRAVALSRYLAALNDIDNGGRNETSFSKKSRINIVDNNKEEQQLCLVVGESSSDSVASCDVEGKGLCGDRDEEERGEVQAVGPVDQHHHNLRRATVSVNKNASTASSSKPHNSSFYRQQQSSSVPSRSKGEAFIVDSSTLMKKSKVWGAAASSVQKTGKFDHRRPSVDNDTYSPNSSNDAIDCPSASDDVVDITGVSITVSGEYDHVTISSEMSGLTPASHLHTPTPTSLHPPQMQQPQQRQQPHDQTSQHDLVAGISSNTPFTSPHISSHQTENHTSPPHNNSVGNQHRNSRHHWPPTPPKTQHHQPSYSSNQTPPQIAPSPTPLWTSKSNQGNTMNPNRREHRAKRGESFTRPQQLPNGNTGSHNAVNNQEQTATPPRWKQKGAMLKIDTGASKRQPSGRTKAKLPQQPISSFQQQQQNRLSLSQAVIREHDDTNNTLPSTPESHESPTIDRNGSEISDPNSSEHHSNCSDKENDDGPTSATAEVNRSPIHERIAAWNQEGNQHSQEHLTYQKQKTQQDLRNSSYHLNKQVKEKNVSMRYAKNDEDVEEKRYGIQENHNVHVSQPLANNEGMNGAPFQRRRHHSVSNSTSPDQEIQSVSAKQSERRDIREEGEIDGDSADAYQLQETLPDPPSQVAVAAAEVAAELVRRGGKSPKAAAAFLATIQAKNGNDIRERGPDDIDINSAEKSRRWKQLRQKNHRKKQLSLSSDKTRMSEEQKQEGQTGVQIASYGVAETTATNEMRLSSRQSAMVSKKAEPGNNTMVKMSLMNSGSGDGIANNLTTGGIRNEILDQQQALVTSRQLVSPPRHTEPTSDLDATACHHSSASTDFETRVQSNLHEMEVRMEARMLRLEARLEAQLKARLEYMEAKMDARLDEIQSILKLMMTVSVNVSGSSSKGERSTDEDYEV